MQNREVFSRRQNKQIKKEKKKKIHEDFLSLYPFIRVTLSPPRRKRKKSPAICKACSHNTALVVRWSKTISTLLMGYCSSTCSRNFFTVGCADADVKVSSEGWPIACAVFLWNQIGKVLWLVKLCWLGNEKPIGQSAPFCWSGFFVTKNWTFEICNFY